MKVLIVGDSCGALEATRELAKAGWSVGIGSESRFGWASASRWASQWHNIPPPLGDPMEFIDEINRVTKAHDYELVFGAGDAEVLALSANRSSLVPHFPYTAHPFVLSVFDKLTLAEIATRAGLRTPATYPADKVPLSDSDFPMIVKARLHWSPSNRNQKTRVKTSVVYTHGDAVRQIQIMRSVGAEPLLQEFIPGHVETFVAVTANTGKILSKHMQRTTREHGSESGISARATSVPIPGDFARQVQDLLTSINWFGLASIQFIQPESGAPVLIDFNGRMYGSLAFANACGMRGMENWARLATGKDPAPTQEILGLRYQALEGDLRYAKKLRGWGRIAELAACLAAVDWSVHPILSWSDPRPTVHYLRRLRLRLAGQKLRAYEMTA